MTINFIILAVVVVGYVSSIFFLKYITFVFSRIKVSLFFSAASFVAYSILSSLFSSLLVAYFQCTDNSMNLICRMMSWKSAWNVTGYIWQIPIFFVVYSICMHIIGRRTEIKSLSIFYIILSTMIYSNLFGFVIIALHGIE